MATRPTDGTCSYWVGDQARYCRATGVRRYQEGWRCAGHCLRALAGLPEQPESPGVPAYRGEEG